MAYIIKNQHRPQATGIQPGILSQWIQVTQPAVALPATTTGQLFRVFGGRVLMRMIIGQVTTIIQAQADNIKISSKALDNTPAAIGTAVDLTANVDGNAKEVGSMYIALGSGAAAIWSNAGAGLRTLGAMETILPQGEVYLTTSATNTGAMKWDMWYQPLDPGSFVQAAVLTAGILTAAI